MEEDDILYQSIIADPEQVSSDVDVSGLRTETDTNPDLLGAVSEFPGLKFDSTSYDQYADLYDLYSRGLPMVDTGTTATDTITTPVVETGGEGGGGESQVTGDLTTTPINTDTSMIGGDLDQGGVGDGITNYEYTPEETAEQQQAIDQSIQDLGSLYNPMTEVPTDPAIADAALSSSFYVPALNPDSTMVQGLDPYGEEDLKAAENPMIVNAYNSVLQGVSSAADFIAQHGKKIYDIYGLVKGGSMGAITGGSSLLGLNPVTGLIGLGLSKVADIVKNTPSQLEYDSYSDEQKEIIEQEYGPGGIMEGYNTVSAFGEGIEATIESRLAQRTGNGIYDETTERLQNLANTVNPSRTNITAAVYDFDDDSQGEQQTFDSQQADQEFAETGDYDVYSGGDTGATSSPTPAADYSYEGSDEQDEATNYAPEPEPTYTAPAPAPAPAPTYTYYDGGSDNDNDSDSGSGSPGSSGPGGSDEMGSFAYGGAVKTIGLNDILKRKKYGKR